MKGEKREEMIALSRERYGSLTGEMGVVFGARHEKQPKLSARGRASRLSRPLTGSRTTRSGRKESAERAARTCQHGGIEPPDPDRNLGFSSKERWHEVARKAVRSFGSFDRPSRLN